MFTHLGRLFPGLILGALLLAGSLTYGLLARAAAVAGDGGPPVAAARPPAVPPASNTGCDDGFAVLPRWLLAVSPSTLIQRGLLHPPTDPACRPSAAPRRAADPGGPSRPPQQPRVTVVWGPARNMSNSPGALEPAAALHPSNPLLAISGGNAAPTLINNTSDGGLTWQQRPDPNAGSGGDSSALWDNPGAGSALFLSLDCCTHFLNLSRSTDSGSTWAAFAHITTFNFSYDRPYLWRDQDPASPFAGRLYATTALFAVSGYFTVGSQWSSDGGVTWSPFLAWVDPYEYNRGENADQFASLAAEPDGTAVGAWVRGKCCGDTPAINVPNQIMWTRSTDGGVTFPVSNTITTVPTNRSMAINSHSPGGFKWNAAPNIAADPLDGTLYAVWVAYRLADQPASAAVYLARGTPDGSSWTAPALVYDNPDPGLFQYMPWVQVSQDHTVHISFGSAVTNLSTFAEFYVQSSDGGQTFSAPFMLSAHTFPPAGFMGDYQAASVGGYAAQQGAILVTWTEDATATDQWGRIGTFALSLPSPTVSATPSGATTTPTPTLPATLTSSPTPPPSPTQTPGAATPTIPPPTTTPCPLTFSDVDQSNPFYAYIRCLACRSIVSGYSSSPPCATSPCFQPGANVTRGQTAKFVSNAANYQNLIPSTQQTFTDVPYGSPFWIYVERAYAHGVISGYSSSPPCTTGVPCFLPGNPVTRSQTAKFVANAARYTDPIPSTQQTFTDVPNSDPFWLYTERAVLHGVISGYTTSPPCTSGVPCFLPYNNVTRGQTAKFIANTFYPNCQTPQR